MFAADIDPATIYLHGNNKSTDELRTAIKAGVGRIVIDNLDEVTLIESAAAEAGIQQPVLLRVSPGVDAHTHEKTTTGTLDSKFGVAITTGHAEEAVRKIAKAEHLDLRGLHMHLGSPIFELTPYERGIEIVTAFWADICRDHLALDFNELSIGGGFAIGYEDEHHPPTPAAYAHTISAALRREIAAHNLSLPQLVIEPGRSLVGRAGLALYTVGTRKEIPGIRTYISVDGGMADNIRPAMYDSRYELLSAERPQAPAEETVTIAGKYCESGDLLVRDIALPRLRTGEIVAMPAAGAYQLAMASNYNLAQRPTVLLLSNGEVRLLRRRETIEDLMLLDIDP
jgi:diaminopimelate decarboxylase